MKKKLVYGTILALAILAAWIWLFKHTHIPPQGSEDIPAVERIEPSAPPFTPSLPPKEDEEAASTEEIYYPPRQTVSRPPAAPPRVTWRGNS